jgi:hypothetical protein
MPITISINSGKDFEPVSEGVHAAVLADIVDLGMVTTAFGEKHKVQFLWMTDEADEDGRTKYVFQRFTASLHEKATLRKAVKQILGRDLTADEKNYDIEQLIGSQVRLIIQHNESNGKIYANVGGIMKPDPKAKVVIPSDFVRKQDRTDAPKANGSAAPKANGKAVAAAVLSRPKTVITDEDIPF